MVRPSKSVSSRKSQVKDKKTFNAKGYAKRQSLKTKKSSNDRNLSDVYEYQPEKERRGKVRMLLEKDEILGAGGNFSEEEDEEDAPRGKGGRGSGRPRLVGENDDDMDIGEDEDEEIDSDGAFDESDEDRFAGFSFASKVCSMHYVRCYVVFNRFLTLSLPLAQKKPQKKVKTVKKVSASARGVRFAEVDLNEDEDHAADPVDPEAGSEAIGDSDEEEEEEEGEPDEFVDVLAIMDGKGEPMSEDEGGEREEAMLANVQNADDEEEEGALRRARFDEEDEGGEEDDNEDESEDDEDDEKGEEYTAAISASEDEDDEHAATKIDSLQSFITNLDAGQKRKLPEDEAESSRIPSETRPLKRRVLKEYAEAGTENEFATHVGKFNF